MVRKALVAERDYTQQLLDDKEAQVALLRERAGRSAEIETHGKDLIHSFGEGAVYEPRKILTRGNVTYTFHGFSTLDCLLFALIPTGLLAVVFLAHWIVEDVRRSKLLQDVEMEQEKQKKKESKSYGCYDD